ncbi:MAG: peroxide stress protein YaaA, partial [Candidatus Cryptobacteroides sp.]
SSCLYGLLRPFDGISQYRMESNLALKATEGKRITDFWRPMLTEILIESVKADDGVLVYLDTEEFRSLFDWKRVVSEIRVIEPGFHVMKNGRLVTPSVWAKTCRGAMARFLIQERAGALPPMQSDPGSGADSLIKEFSYEGFTFSGYLNGNEDFPQFVRDAGR